MRAKLIVHFMVAVLSITFIFNSCNEPITVVNEESIKQESRVLKKGTTQDKNSTAMVTGTGKLLGYKVVDKDGKKVKVPIYYGNTNDQIQPDRYPCNYYTEIHYETDHFEPKSGKVVGIWPYEYTVSNLNVLKTKWGYSGIHVSHNNNSTQSSQYNIAKSAGYDWSQIMMDIKFNTDYQRYKTIVDNYKAKYYYIDEAVNHGCFGNAGYSRIYRDYELNAISNYIHLYRPYSEFVSSGYKRCGHFNTLVSIVDKIMYSSYKNWDVFPGYCNSNLDWGTHIEFYEWLPSLTNTYDQREDWDDMKNRYNNKFSLTWIETSEITEFYDLFKKANNLGINEVWIYGFMGDDGQPVAHYNDQFENISNAAFQYGFLRKFMKKYKYWYKCPEYYGDPCYCKNNNSGWVLDHISYLGIVEVYPN